MAPLGFSAGVRKARELGRRSLSLAMASRRMVAPQAHYDALACDGILVLQRGENASTDYYVRPRLERADTPYVITDLASPPEHCALLAPGGAQALMVIFVRYGAESWLGALAAVRRRLSRVAFFMDDDLPAMISDPELPRAARGKVALHFGAQVERIGGLASEVWVSTQVLADRYEEVRPRVLAPIPEADPPAPAADTPRKAVYHGTDVHPQERLFALEIARRLAGADVDFEITGGPQLARAAADLSGVTITPQLTWPQFRRRQATTRAAVSLAPLMPSALNAARAPVKAFDAARLGAAGIFADVEPYRSFVRDGEDGLVLPMEPQRWAEAILDLLANPERRLRLAARAQARLIELRRSAGSFPAPAQA
jgi:hypothetical protein